jgi:hypothetical protein
VENSGERALKVKCPKGLYSVKKFLQRPLVLFVLYTVCLGLWSIDVNIQLQLASDFLGLFSREENLQTRVCVLE